MFSNADAAVPISSMLSRSGCATPTIIGPGGNSMNPNCGPIRIHKNEAISFACDTEGATIEYWVREERSVITATDQSLDSTEDTTDVESQPRKGRVLFDPALSVFLLRRGVFTIQAMAKAGHAESEVVTATFDASGFCPCPEYNDYPLSDYVDDGNTQFINKDFPGLQAIHRDPWIFLVHDLYSKGECDALITKCRADDDGKPKLRRATSANSVTGETSSRRSSTQVRLHYSEVAGLQSRIASLINVPSCNFEAMKVCY
jgi:hypothetical protein